MFAVSTLLGTGIEVLNPRWGFARVLRSVADIVSTTLFSLATIGGGLILAVWFPDGRRTSRLGPIVEALVVLVVVGRRRSGGAGIIGIFLLVVGGLTWFATLLLAVVPGES